MGIIYEARNTTNNMLYIGKTVNTLRARATQHCSDAKRGSTTYFHNAIRKYGCSSFEFRILAEIDNSLLNAAEIYYIELALDQGYVLYNLTDGGEGAVGYTQSEITKHKKHLAMLGNKNSLGYKHSDETKQRMSQIQLGKTKQYIVESNKARAKTYTLTSPSGTVTAITNMSEFCRQNNLNTSAMLDVVKGKRRSYKGWTK